MHAGWESLSHEEREQLKKALGEIWTDPGVISAREEVHVAAGNYQKALKSAMSKSNPKVAALMSRVQKNNEGSVKQFLGSRPRPPGGAFPRERSIEDLLKGSAEHWSKLSDEQKQKVTKAREQASQDEDVKAAMAELGKLRGQEEAFRKERLGSYMKLRQAYHKAMVKADPEVAKLLPKGKEGMRGPKGGPKGGKKGS